MGKSSGRNRFVFIALFAALISVSSVIAIPAGPLGVPIVMQNMLAVLSGALLGGVTGAAATALFLFAGILGAPVFSGGAGGVARLLGPTGGFLAGYLLGALAAGLLLGRPSVAERPRFLHVLKVTLSLLAGHLLIYVSGVLWLARFLMRKDSIDFAHALPGALAAGVIPFIPGGIVKLILSVALTLALRPVAARYLNPHE
jgi:biotin transport system substrate-specific component